MNGKVLKVPIRLCLNFVALGKVLTNEHPNNKKSKELVQSSNITWPIQ